MLEDSHLKKSLYEKLMPSLCKSVYIYRKHRTGDRMIRQMQIPICFSLNVKNPCHSAAVLMQHFNCSCLVSAEVQRLTNVREIKGRKTKLIQIIMTTSIFSLLEKFEQRWCSLLLDANGTFAGCHLVSDPAPYVKVRCGFTCLLNQFMVSGIASILFQ